MSYTRHYRHRPPESFESYEELMAAEYPLPYVQGALALNFDPKTRHAELMLEDDGVSFDYQPTDTTDLPAAQAWAERISQNILEVLAGIRPASQLVRHLSPSVHAKVSKRGSVAARRRLVNRQSRIPGRAIYVRKLLTSAPTPGTVECAVVVQEGERVRAMAMRIIGLDGRWRVVDLTLG